MRYLTPQELTSTNRDEARAILTHCAGKSVRDLFAIAVFNNYHDRSFGRRATTKILDLGAASGTFLRQLHAENYRELFGVDIDEYVAAENRTFLREFRTVDFSNGQLPWPGASFDVATAWCVLPHLENPFHCVREIARVLVPGGLFVFTTPFLTSKPSRDYFAEHGDFKSYRRTNNHIVLFPPGVMAKTIFRYFEPIGIEYHARLAKIFRGPKGKLREMAYRMSGLYRPWQKRLEARWAYNIVYVTRRKSETQEAPA